MASCYRWQPRPRATNGGKPGRNGAARPTPEASPTSTAASSTADGASLALGGGAVLLGAMVLAVYLVRRPPSDRRQPPRP